jgi:hypothetical protein
MRCASHLHDFIPTGSGDALLATWIEQCSDLGWLEDARQYLQKAVGALAPLVKLIAHNV